MSHQTHYPSLTSGFVIVALGAVALLDSLDIIDLTFAVLWPLLLGGLGLIILSYGVTRR